MMNEEPNRDWIVRLLFAIYLGSLAAWAVYIYFAYPNSHP